jgi:hypothetical protein
MQFRDTGQFEMTSKRGRPSRDPDVTIVRKILVHLSGDNYYAVRAFVGFLHNDPTVASRFAWRPHTV